MPHIIISKTNPSPASFAYINTANLYLIVLPMIISTTNPLLTSVAYISTANPLPTGGPTTYTQQTQNIFKRSHENVLQY